MQRTANEKSVMRTVRTAGLGAVAALTLALSGPAQAEDAGTDVAPPKSVTQHWDVLNDSCTECHNYMDWAGEIAFDTMAPEGVPRNAEIWEKVVRKVRGGLMPPPGKPRPPEDKMDAFVASLEGYLDEANAATGPHPGRVALHRLNRKEYANAVRDLLGIDIDPAAMLPQDNSSDGFDNIAVALQVSPTFLDQYIGAARKVAVQAVGETNPSPGSSTYVNDNARLNNRHVEGLPLGTRGGMAVDHYFPADGEYVMNIANMAAALWVYNQEFENTLIVTIDDRKIYETTIGGEQDIKAIDQLQDTAVDRINERLKNIRFSAKAGTHKVGVTFLRRSYAESDDRLEVFTPGGGQDRILRVDRFEIRGPFNPTGISETETRQRIFTCHPEREAEARPCAREIISGLARRAYRRPVTERDMDQLLAFYQAGREAGNFDTGIRKALTAILSSPYFLYRVAPPPEDVGPGEIYELNDVELASRLSFFLWSSIPDEELLDVAGDGRLSDPQVLKAQIQRMLADPKARALARNFAYQWLGLRRLDEVKPDSSIFPYASGRTDPREAYKTEIELFVDSIFREDRSVVALLTADHTYLNEQVALMYGIHDVKGDRFRRVELEDPNRFGLLGKGAVLMASAYPNRTSPVLRGAWILENILATPPAAPPPGVNTDIADNKKGEVAKTVRERLEEHRSKPSCNMCHGIMDPMGFALQNFNTVGMWRPRDRESGRPINALAEMPDGTQVNGPLELRDALLKKKDLFVEGFIEKLMTYALGRNVEHDDMPAVRAIAERAAKDDYRFSSIVMGIVQSDQFRMQRAPESDVAGTQEAALRDE